MKTIDYIRKIPISSVISRYVHLSKTGDNFYGICPFHRDTNPSLRVSDTKGMFKCFACGAGGDAITFVMEYKKLSFIEAIEEIAKENNIPYDETTYNRSKSALDILANIKKIYVEQGERSSELEDFVRKRQISLSTVQKFELGFASDEHSITKYFISNRLPLELGIELGVLRMYEGAPVDVFRNYVILPIHDEKGNCVGFCGRAIKDHSKPKYLNSKQSFVFDKSKLLYGLNFSKNYIVQSKSLIIVEGYMDMISLYDQGFGNVVACMGLGMSDAAITKLKSLTNNVLIAFDSDEAGKKARERVSELFLRHKIICKAIDLNPFKDPDEMMKSPNGVSQFMQRTHEATPLLDQSLFQLVFTHSGTSIEDKSRCIELVFEKVSPLGIDLRATERIMNCATMLGLQSGERMILKNYEKYLEASK